MQLGLSTTIVIGVAVLYGVNPDKLLLLIFEFSINSIALKNIFRAMMGLYAGFAIYWIIGISKPEYWKSATISNIIFMGGLASGRILSLALDGISTQFTIALVLELIFMAWGIKNLKNEEVLHDMN